MSVREAGGDVFNARTEIKKLNSFRALTLGTDYEIERQSEIYERGGVVEDECFIHEAVMKVLNDNPSEVEKYLADKETLLQWFMGQVARATKGKADPNVTKELMLKALEDRRT